MTSTPEVYPEPLPVITASLILPEERDPWTIILIELQDGGLVLPGGIWELWRGQTIIQCRDSELEQEVGAETIGEPELFLIDTRTNKDRREFAGHQTTHCCDFIWLGSVKHGAQPRPTDLDEVKTVRQVDLRNFDVRLLARGHGTVVMYYISYMKAGEKTLPPNKLIVYDHPWL